MKIGFVGCGNMATSIMAGLVNAGFEGSNINGYDVNEDALNYIKEKFNANTYTSESMLIDMSDVVIFAVKPSVLASVLSIIYNADNKVFVSIAAGKTIEFIENHINAKAKIVRVMPNINASVQESISAYCTNRAVTDEDKVIIEKILSTFGKCMYLNENYFPIFGVLGGCAPAFVYMFIDELARAAVQNGMKKEDAKKIAAQTVYGSAKMILESDEHPYQLVDNVCSPGGTTIEGVVSLKRDGFSKAINNAVNASFEKDYKLQQN